MSALVFPSLPGLAWGMSKKAVWNSRVQKSVSGKRMAIGYMTYPIYQYTVNFNVLREYSGNTDLEQLQSFFNNMRGQVDTFLFTDPEDSAVTTAWQFGTGNGTTAAFQLTRSYGGYIEPVQTPSIVNLTVSDWQGVDQPQRSSSRTNRITNSESVNSWSQINTSTAGDVTTAPDGTATGDKVLGNATAGNHYVDTSTYTPADNAVISASVFVKKADYDYVQITLYHKGGGGTDLRIKLTDGSVTVFNAYTLNGVTSTYSVVAVNNGWYRISLNNLNVGTGATAPRLRVYLCDNTGNPSFTGSTSLGTFVWGGQIEDGAASYRYIKTTTAAVAQTDYTVGTTGIITFGYTPPNGALLKWTGTFYWRCVFTMDTLEVIQDFNQIWKSGKITFETVKL